MGGKAGNFLVGKAGADRQAFEGLALFEQLAETASVLGQDLDQRTELLDRGIEILDFRRGDFEGEGRIIARQDGAVTINNDAAIGRNRHQRNAVVLGAGNVILVPDDLQPGKTGEQDGKRQQHRDRGKDDAETEAVKLAIPLVFWKETLGQVAGPQIGRLASCSIGRYCGISSTKVSGNHKAEAMNGPIK